MSESEVYHDVTPNADGGVLKLCLVEGAGQNPYSGDTCSVNYVGTYNGAEFDRNIGGYPFAVKLGEGKVIPGWEIGLPTMRMGEKSKFRIAPEYAYGKQGSGDDIPPGATLEFTIELVGIRGALTGTQKGNTDLDRLAELRRQREEAAKKRQEEKDAKDKGKSEAQAKLQAKLASKNKKGGGKKK